MKEPLGTRNDEVEAVESGVPGEVAVVRRVERLRPTFEGVVDGERQEVGEEAWSSVVREDEFAEAGRILDPEMLEFRQTDEESDDGFARKSSVVRVVD